MIFFLFLYFFPYILGDCLKFSNDQSMNKCFIQQSANHTYDIEYYYPECLLCTIQTLIESENIKYEEDNQCSLIQLQCIQIIFNTKEIFEDFFQYHKQIIYDLFNKTNGTDQNTLHIIIKENIFEEINAEYIEKIFRFKYQTYRALFFQLYIQNDIIKINRNLINLIYLSIKIILICGNNNNMQTIYTIHEQNITLESSIDFCSTMLIPSLILTTLDSIIKSSSNELLSISNEKSKDIILTIILLIGSLLFLLTTSIIICTKYLKRYYSRLSTQHKSISESSISQNTSMETPVSINEKPIVNIKVKKPFHGMHAIQLLDDDI